MTKIRDYPVVRGLVRGGGEMLGSPTPGTADHLERLSYLEPHPPATRSKQPHHQHPLPISFRFPILSPAAMALARDSPAAKTPNPNETTPTTRVIAASINPPASDPGVAIGLHLFSVLRRL